MAYLVHSKKKVNPKGTGVNIKTLYSKGGFTEEERVLRSKGIDEDHEIIYPKFRFNTSTNRFEGSYWCIRSNIWESKFLAREFWDTDSNLVTRVRADPGAFNFDFETTDKFGSEWLPSTNFDLEFFNPDKDGNLGESLQPIELKKFKMHDKDLSLKLMIEPLDGMTKAKLHMAAFPRKPSNIDSVAATLGLADNIHKLPVKRLKPLSCEKGNCFITTNLGIQETNEGIGLGVLPIIECFSRPEEEIQVEMSRKMLCTEMSNFMKMGHGLAAIQTTGPLEKLLTPTSYREGAKHGAMKKHWPLLDVPENTSSAQSGQYYQAKRYGDFGLYSPGVMVGLGVEQSVSNEIASSMNAVFASSTWKTYKTALNAVKQVEVEMNIKLAFPWSFKDVANFIGYLQVQGRKESTIISYTASIKSLHKVMGKSTDGFSNAYTQILLKGVSHLRTAPKEKFCLTPDIMWRLRKEIASNTSKALDPIINKHLIWTILTLMYSAALRGSEILCPKVNQVTAGKTMTWRDINVKADGSSMSVNIKAPKEMPTMSNIKIDLYSCGTFLDPVVAVQEFMAEIEKYEDINGDWPIARWRCGKLFTKDKFTSILKELLTNLGVNTRMYAIGTHCPRNGVVSIMAREGFEDSDIQAFGRWSSSAYQVYLKRGINKRKKMRLTIAKKLVKAARISIDATNNNA